MSLVTVVRFVVLLNYVNLYLVCMHPRLVLSLPVLLLQLNLVLLVHTTVERNKNNQWQLLANLKAISNQMKIN